MSRKRLNKTAAWLYMHRFWLCWYTNADSDETTAYSETLYYFQLVTRK